MHNCVGSLRLVMYGESPNLCRLVFHLWARRRIALRLRCRVLLHQFVHLSNSATANQMGKSNHRKQVLHLSWARYWAPRHCSACTVNRLVVMGRHMGRDIAIRVIRKAVRPVVLKASTLPWWRLRLSGVNRSREANRPEWAAVNRNPTISGAILQPHPAAPEGQRQQAASNDIMYFFFHVYGPGSLIIIYRNIWKINYALNRTSYNINSLSFTLLSCFWLLCSAEKCHCICWIVDICFYVSSCAVMYWCTFCLLWEHQVDVERTPC